MFSARLYLDFDGVVNAENPQHELIEKFVIAVEGSFTLGKENHIVFSPNVIEYLEYLREIYNVELVWLSTWNDRNDVLQLVEPLGGLHGGRVITANPNHDAKDKHEWTHWKGEAIIADQKANPIPFVWIDDNAHHYHGDTVKEATAGIASLFLTPATGFGLTNENLQAIEAFLKNPV